MVLLRGAERSRRLVITLAVVAGCAAQAIRPLAGLEALAAVPVRSAQSLLLPLAAAACSVVYTPAQAEDRAAPTLGLIDVERKAGYPAAVAGAAWLEIPVLRVDRADGELRLGAGANLHLAKGMPVAFGSIFLGRLIEVEAERSTVRLVQAANERTGVYLRAKPEQLGDRAVAVGQSSGKAPLLALIDPDARMWAGSAVIWRPQLADGLAADATALRLGELERVGSRDRGDAAWAIALDFPAGSEGRVFVLASAVGDKLIAERRTEVEEAWASLPADGVLGRGWPAISLGAAPVGAVVCSADRAVGVVAVKRGRYAWLRVRPAQLWGREALAVSEEDFGIYALNSESPAERGGEQLYTRGGGAVPRGLWLGTREDGAAPLAAPLSVHADRTSVDR